jgi:hypothetical protein
MNMKLVTVAACLLSFAAAQPPPPSDTVARSAPPNRPASRFISVELLFAGPGLSASTYKDGHTIARLCHIGVEFNRVRLGLAYFDVAANPFICLLPVTAGYTIHERPVRYAGSLYAKVPEIYVEAMGGFINTNLGNQLQPADMPFRGTLELVCSVDGYGVGASVAAGCYYYYDEYPWQGGSNKLGFYAAARLHLLRLRLGF